MLIPDTESEFFPSRIPDPGSKIFLDSASASKNLSILTQKFVSKLSYVHPGIRILDLDLNFLPFPDPRSRIQGSKRHQIQHPGFPIQGSKRHRIPDLGS
jgi:hypothetical protein